MSKNQDLHINPAQGSMGTKQIVFQFKKKYTLHAQTVMYNMTIKFNKYVVDLYIP